MEAQCMAWQGLKRRDTQSGSKSELAADFISLWETPLFEFTSFHAIILHSCALKWCFQLAFGAAGALGASLQRQRLHWWWPCCCPGMIAPCLAEVPARMGLVVGRVSAQLHNVAKYKDLTGAELP